VLVGQMRWRGRGAGRPSDDRTGPVVAKRKPAPGRVRESRSRDGEGKPAPGTVREVSAGAG